MEAEAVAAAPSPPPPQSRSSLVGAAFVAVRVSRLTPTMSAVVVGYKGGSEDVSVGGRGRWPEKETPVSVIHGVEV